MVSAPPAADFASSAAVSASIKRMGDDRRSLLRRMEYGQTSHVARRCAC
jgi:hypothetical protein